MFAGPEALEAFRRLEREGRLNMRVDVAICINDLFADYSTLEESEEILARRQELTTDLIRLSAKFFSDGTPLSYTSFLLEPYADRPEEFGQMTVGPQDFDRMIQLHKRGIPMRHHSGGDGTTRKLLDVIEKAHKESPLPNLRHHLGHLFFVNPDDIPRFKELNVIAEFSPTFFYPSPLTMLGEPKVGKERHARWQPIKEFVDAGVTVTWGSDWPAGTPDADPWRSLEAMVTRRDPHGEPTGAQLGAGIDLATGIKILTLNGAYAMNQENVTGSIEVGKFADMVVLDQNPFDEVERGRPDLISEVHVLKTVFEGRVVYDAHKPAE